MDQYLTPREDDALSGQNLEYDPIFTAMELAARAGEERQVGDEIVPASEPDYREAARSALAVLERSHDLRAAVVLALARLKLGGLAGLAEVTTYTRRCLEEFWETCHPQLDAEDDDDPTMRVNAVLGLADATILRALKDAELAKSPGLGRVSLRDITIAEGEISPPEGMAEPPTPALIEAIFTAADADALAATLAAARTVQGDVEAIDHIFAERTPGQGPELEPLIKLVRRIAGHLADATGAPADDAAIPEAAGAEGTAPASAATPAGGAPGVIASPRDVETALERIIHYYRNHEPSSPLPILLERARRLVGADFVTIMKDIAPGGMDNVYVVGGIEPDED